MKRSLSGIKSTGIPHLGNYLGMIRPAIDLQEEHEAFYFVAEYHALTTERDPAAMRESTRMITAYFLAFGLDPDRSAFFRQSAVPEVTELAWMLSCVTNMGVLERAHAYKAAKDKGIANEINHGLFGYPVLMAADILIYDSDVVPVGQDQVQHVEMARLMARHFNAAFGGEYLKPPEPLVQKDVATVPGIDGRKMSKSYGNIIEPLTTTKQLRKQVMKIVTEPTPMEDPFDPDACNVFGMYKLFATPDEQSEMREKYQRSDYGFGHAKQALYEKMDEYFSPYRDRYTKLMEDPSYLEDVLAAGSTRVRPVVDDVMERVRSATGLGPLSG
jgi:tryptophanyl-tRNA synthetase